METKFIYGTYNVPSTSVNLSATYSVPAMVSKEVIENIVASQNEEVNKTEDDKTNLKSSSTLSYAITAPM